MPVTNRFIFGHNPQSRRWEYQIGQKYQDRYSVQRHSQRIKALDIGMLYVHDGHNGGAFMEAMKILSIPFQGDDGETYVHTRTRPLELMITQDMLLTEFPDAWTNPNRKPVGARNTYASPILMDPEQWASIRFFLSQEVLDWLDQRELSD